MTGILFLPFHSLHVGTILRHTVSSCFQNGCQWLWGTKWGKETTSRGKAASVKSCRWFCISPPLYQLPEPEGWNAPMALAWVASSVLLAWSSVSLPRISKWKPGLWGRGNGGMSMGKQLTNVHSELFTGDRKGAALLWSSFPLYNCNYLVCLFLSGSLNIIL